MHILAPVALLTSTSSCHFVHQKVLVKIPGPEKTNQKDCLRAEMDANSVLADVSINDLTQSFTRYCNDPPPPPPLGGDIWETVPLFCQWDI